MVCSVQSKVGEGTGWWVPKKLLSAPLQNGEGGSQAPCSPVCRKPELSSPSRRGQEHPGLNLLPCICGPPHPSSVHPERRRCFLQPPQNLLATATTLMQARQSPARLDKGGVLQHFLCSSIPIDQPVVPFQLQQRSPFRDPYRDRADKQERPAAFVGLGVPPWGGQQLHAPHLKRAPARLSGMRSSKTWVIKSPVKVNTNA